MKDSYRPTAKDLQRADDIEMREFVPVTYSPRILYGKPPSDAGLEIIAIIREAHRIGKDGIAATVGEAKESLKDREVKR